MTLRYLLFEKDYLENQLYYASKSKMVKKYKRNAMNNMILVFALMTIYFFTLGNYSFLLIFMIVCVLMLVVYPGFVLNRLKQSYQKAIVELFKNRFGQTAVVEFKETSILGSDSMRSTEVFHSSIQSIEEIGTHFFIYMKYGEQLIIPKTEVDKEAVNKHLHQLATQLDIPYNSNVNWKWK